MLVAVLASQDDLMQQFEGQSFSLRKKLECAHFSLPSIGRKEHQRAIEKEGQDVRT